MTAHPQEDLFTPQQLGSLTLKNRFVMAPMTRSRAGAGNVATDLMRTYYAQRASAGLIITEGTQVSPQGVGYIDTPGIHSPEQVAAWRHVTDGVHAAGSVIFAQLWHVGRVSHRDFQNGELPVAPSAIPFVGESYTRNGRQKAETPRALEIGEIKAIVEDFRRAAENAKLAGFDGVEIHGANGYLIDQFLQDISNKRTDEYGGSIANRARFLVEITEAVISVWGKERVGVRLSPHSTFNTMGDSLPHATFSHAIAELNRLGVAYVHLIGDKAGYFSKQVNGIVIANGGYDYQSATQAVSANTADLVAFGIPFIANPDLPERFKQHAPLNKADHATFYGGDAKGYTDYPALSVG